MAALKDADDIRWKAVIAKDKGADGQFYFSVRTTRVYCRPSCPARPARRENVAFHLSCDAAEAAGFRACKRCRPREASQCERDAAMVARVCDMLQKFEEPPRLAALAEVFGLSAFHFHRVFKAVTGLTLKAYADAHRSDRVRKALPSSKTITGAIYDAGFNSNGRFYAKSAQLLGMTPRRYRAGGDRTQIRFAIGECFLGSILVAATDKGVCSILIGSDPDALVRQLQDAISKAVSSS